MMPGIDIVKASEDALLATRVCDLFSKQVCDLSLRIENSELADRIKQLEEELKRKKIPFIPHFYLGDEWFSPEGVPAVSIPFYLAHPRLKRLEEKMMLEVEGGSADECMKLLRHETGHALEHAYAFRRTRPYRKVFGSPSSDYDPDTYIPKPYSRKYVRHLPNWYAQSHPDEDFAETFAVWLAPDSNWKTKYRKWKAWDKLVYMEKLISTLPSRKIRNQALEETYHVSKLRFTLNTFYRRKKRLYEEEFPDFFDPELRKIFPTTSGGELAYRFLQRSRKDLADAIARGTSEPKYTANALIKRMIERLRILKLRSPVEDPKAQFQIGAYLASLVTHYRYTGRFKRSI